jgi:hypothetical protein
LYKSWFRGSDGATMGKTIFTCVYIGKNLLKSSSPELTGQFQSNLTQIILAHMGIQVLQIKDHVFFKR